MHLQYFFYYWALRVSAISFIRVAQLWQSEFIKSQIKASMHKQYAKDQYLETMCQCFRMYEFNCFPYRRTLFYIYIYIVYITANIRSSSSILKKELFSFKMKIQKM